jgi:hypothetical protein
MSCRADNNSTRSFTESAESLKLVQAALHESRRREQLPRALHRWDSDVAQMTVVVILEPDRAGVEVEVEWEGVGRFH